MRARRVHAICLHRAMEDSTSNCKLSLVPPHGQAPAAVANVGKNRAFTSQDSTMAAFLTLVLLLLGMAALLPRVAAVDRLQAGSHLSANQFLQSGNFYLLMQGDCNLVIYQGAQCCTNATATWATGTWNRGLSGDGCVASMQQDGNFVVYGGGNKITLWATNTSRSDVRWDERYYVQLQSDGSLKVMEGSTNLTWSHVPVTAGAPAPAPAISIGAPPPPAAAAPGSLSIQGSGYMSQGNNLQPGSFLRNTDVTLTLEQNCKLQSKYLLPYAVYGGFLGSRVLWETGSNRTLGGCELILKKDSTLQIRIRSSGEVYEVWKHNVSNPGNAVADRLLLNKDGTVAVYSTNETVIWTMGQSTPLPPRTSRQPPPEMYWFEPPPDGTAGHGMIAGITSGVLGGSILLGVTLCCALRLYGYFDKAKEELQQRLKNNRGRCRALTLHQIWKATNNNERLLGRGGFGPVYYGRLQDGQEVAVKALSATSSQGKQEFFNEIELLSVVHHKYLVSLVGYCTQWKQQILVYEYMSGGDLRDRLHGEESSAAPLSWNQRTKIILQVAEGIQYLHEGCKPAIIHRDIKTNNILLAGRMVAKVADFGLSKLFNIDSCRDDADVDTHITTAVKGTIGYLDPEYYVSQKLTEKSDVYAYGVLLMEIITGRSLVDNTDHMYIVQKVRIGWKSKELDGLADPNLGGNYDDEEFSGLVKLSLWCVKQSSSDRPSMSQVVHELKEIGVVLPGTSHPSEAVAGADKFGDLDAIPPENRELLDQP